MESTLLHELIEASSRRFADRDALAYGGTSLTTRRCRRASPPSRRRSCASASPSPTVSASISKSASRPSSRASAPPAAGAVFVPLNPLLKPEQVAYILRDCNVRVLVTSPERLALLGADRWPQCPDLRHVVVDRTPRRAPAPPRRRAASTGTTLLDAPRRARPPRRSTPTWRRSSTPRAAPASPRAWCCRTATWWPARRASPRYLENHADDTLLAALPLSFDAGFSQLTTAFHAGARVVLLNYLLPRDVLNALARERVTGLTAVPPL